MISISNEPSSSSVILEKDTSDDEGPKYLATRYDYEKLVNKILGGYFSDPMDDKLNTNYEFDSKSKAALNYGPEKHTDHDPEYYNGNIRTEDADLHVRLLRLGPSSFVHGT